MVADLFIFIVMDICCRDICFLRELGTPCLDGEVEISEKLLFL